MRAVSMRRTGRLSGTSSVRGISGATDSTRVAAARIVAGMRGGALGAGAGRLDGQAQRARLQAGGVEQVVDQLTQALGFFVDDVQKFGPSPAVPGGILAQPGRGGAFDR